PLAQWIEQKHAANPTQVHNPETKPNTRRDVTRRKLIQRAQKLISHRLPRDETQTYGDQVRCVPLQQVKKQRNAAEGHEYISKSPQQRAGPIGTKPRIKPP